MAVDPIQAQQIAKTTLSSNAGKQASGFNFNSILAQAQGGGGQVDPGHMPDKLPALPLDVLNRHMTPQQLASFVSEMVPESDRMKKQRKYYEHQQDMASKIERGEQAVYAQATPDDATAVQGALSGDEPLQAVQQESPFEQGVFERAPRTSIVPFQLFLDKSLQYFQNVSGMEMKTDQMMVDYIEGRVSIEELTIEKAKVSVALSFAVTILQQVTNAFNEVKNMSI